MTPRLMASAIACLLLAFGPARAAAPGGFVAVPGGRIWYESCGSGPETVVLLHDGLIHSVGFDAVWPGLCSRFHVVRYDRRGYGRSRGAGHPYSPVEDLVAVMRAAGMEHASLVGASSGGGLAIDMALAHPQAVDRLVLIGADVSGIKHTDSFFARVPPVAARMKRLDFKGGVRLISEDPWIVAAGHDAARAEIRRILGGDLHNLLHKDRQLPRPIAASHLGEITAPTLVLIGAADHPDVQGQAEIIAATVPGARRLVVPEAGHLIYMERPDAFIEAVSGFLDAPLAR